MGVAARRRGIEITHAAQPLKSKDVDDYDLLICMDPKNKAAVLGEVVVVVVIAYYET